MKALQNLADSYTWTRQVHYEPTFCSAKESLGGMSKGSGSQPEIVLNGQSWKSWAKIHGIIDYNPKYKIHVCNLMLI